MQDAVRAGDDDCRGLRRLALELAIQLPIERDAALTVLKTVREILDVVHQAGSDEPTDHSPA
jgi:hypothetical protein